jgi:hypothetical protein
VSGDEAGLWPVVLSEIVGDTLYDPDWREILIPDGHGIAEYRINQADHQVILTRIVVF